MREESRKRTSPKYSLFDRTGTPVLTRQVGLNALAMRQQLKREGAIAGRLLPESPAVSIEGARHLLILPHAAITSKTFCTRSCHLVYGPPRKASTAGARFRRNSIATTDLRAGDQKGDWKVVETKDAPTAL